MEKQVLQLFSLSEVCYYTNSKLDFFFCIITAFFFLDRKYEYYSQYRRSLNSVDLNSTVKAIYESFCIPKT